MKFPKALPAERRGEYWWMEQDGRELRRSYAEMAARSNQVANWLRALGVARSDRVVVMNDGRVIAQGTPDEVRNDEKVVDAYLGARRG